MTDYKVHLTFTQIEQALDSNESFHAFFERLELATSNLDNVTWGLTNTSTINSNVPLNKEKE